MPDNFSFTFQGKSYPYTSSSHYKCEFCDRRAQWNAIVPQPARYTFVCDEHFLEHCQPEKAARFYDPRPNEAYTLTTIDELLDGVEALKARYSAQGKASMGD